VSHGNHTGLDDRKYRMELPTRCPRFLPKLSAGSALSNER
jgi:hypothetical protein